LVVASWLAYAQGQFQGQGVDWVAIVAQHGYALIAAILFLGAIGLPLPMALGLLAAGAASHHELRPEVVLAVAWSAAMLGDLLLYLGGKFTGWWLLTGICRVSLNPEQCIFASADSFYKRGPQTLLFAKFIPGLGTVAAPLAGSLHMRLGRFLRLMALGELLYCGSWLMAGYVFYRFVQDVAQWMESVGHAILLAVLVLAAGYGLTFLFFVLRSRRYREIEKISAASLRERIDEAAHDHLVVIADVRSHNYYDPGMQRIKNSIRVEPNRLQEELAALKEFMAPNCEIYLYCSCIRDTTSVRVAHAMKQANLRTVVIEGGMKAWVKAGGALEPVPEQDLQRLPQFD
jgi:membrane protein DedA with SNARE-associated domain/rhodanese-related sulfurtransferase